MQAVGRSIREGQSRILWSQDRFAAGIARPTPPEQGETPAYNSSRSHSVASDILKVKIASTSEQMCPHYYTYKHRCDLQKVLQPATT